MKNHTILRLLAYIKPFTPLILLSFFLALLISVTDLLNPYITSVIIDKYIMDPSSSLNIYLMGGLYLATVLFGGILQYAQVYILNMTGQKIMHNIRLQVFTHLQFMPLSYYDVNSSGRILTRATSDVEALNELYSGVIVSLVKDVIMLIGIVVVMLRMNSRLALVSFCIVPLIVVITILYNKKAKANFKTVRTLSGLINGFFAENISGMRLVQIFNREREKYDEFDDLNTKYNKASVFAVALNALFKPGSELINSLAISIIIWYAAGGVFGGTLEIGVLYAFITYIKKFFAPINDLADKYSTIQSGLVSAERIFELLDLEGQMEQMDVGMEMSDVKGEIEFRNVWFSYDNQEWVLRDISFTVKPGETVAFVGATGSGKSTIINLIGRFYEIQKGEILLDGVNIRDIRRSSLRRNIAVVMQDVFLFAGDIKSNIRLNNEDIDDEDIYNAVNFVNAESFVKSLPGGYNEEVKERAATLSSGQRQLLSFARAVAFNPVVIVLDEATANIDTENEQLIQKSLANISQNHTTLVIAHRLSTIAQADKIMVIQNGEIKESGRHVELLQRDGLYKKLYELQFV